MTDPATDPTAATPPIDPTGETSPPTTVDLGRRRFFRAFAGELVQTAATMVGAAQALQQVSAEAASAILNPGATEAPAPAMDDTAFRGDRTDLVGQRAREVDLEFERRVGLALGERRMHRAGDA